MVTVTLDEITANAVKAALDLRVARLSADVERQERDGWNLPHQSDAAQQAYVYSVAALHETEQAREAFSDPDWTEAELAVGYGK